MLPNLLSEKKRQPAECLVKLGAAEKEISDFYPFLTELVVEASRKNPAVATLSFETRRKEDGKWAVQDEGPFEPWTPILIEAAFGDMVEEVFRGYVRMIRAEYPIDAGASKVTVECQDESLTLDRDQVRQDWGADGATTDKAILDTIAGRHPPLSAHEDSKPGQSGLVLNQDATDVAFLRERAIANSYELIFRAKKIYFGPMRLDAAAQPNLMVYAGPDTNCLSFSVTEEGHQPDSVVFEIAAESGSGTVRREVVSDLPTLGRTKAESTSSGQGQFTWKLSRRGGRNEEEMAARAKKSAEEQAMKVKAEGELDGSLYGHVLLAGIPVGVDGAGDRYDGIYYVDSVSHRFDTNGYRQNFKLLRNAIGDNLESSSSPLDGLI